MKVEQFSTVVLPNGKSEVGILFGGIPFFKPGQAKAFWDGNGSACICLSVMRDDKPALLLRNELITEAEMTLDIVITRELALLLIDELATLFPFSPTTKRFNLLKREPESSEPLY